jgi:hypothetical protein
VRQLFDRLVVIATQLAVLAVAVGIPGGMKW